MSQSREPRKPATWHIEVWRSKRVIGRQRYRIRVVDDGNNHILAQGEAYTNKRDAFDTALLLAAPAKAVVYDKTGE